METFLAILLVLGVYVVAPAIVGFAIVGGIVLAARRRRATARQAERPVAEHEAAPEAKPGQEMPTPVAVGRNRGGRA